MLVENFQLAWVGCIPVCALVGALAQLLIPRDWPKAALGVAYVSLASAAVFALRGILATWESEQLQLVVFPAFGMLQLFAISANRMAWCLIALLLVIAWIALQTRGGKHGTDAAMAGCWLGLGVAAMSLSGSILLDAIGLGLALGVLCISGVPGGTSAKAAPSASLSIMLAVAAVLMNLLALHALPISVLNALDTLKHVPVEAITEIYHLPSALTLMLAARVLAFLAIANLLWQCKEGLERGTASRWLPLVLLALGFALIKPVPPMAYLEVEMPLLPVALWGVGLAAGIAVLLILYTRPKVHGILGVAAELLNQIPMLLVEFIRMLLLLPLYKARGKRVVFKSEPRK